MAVEKAEKHVPKYTMGVVVKLTGVPDHRLRRYEEAGLLKPARTPAGQRLYSDADLEVIREIVPLEEEGINLKGIKAILALRREQTEKR
mgnify:CR=1 FL=1